MINSVFESTSLTSYFEVSSYSTNTIYTCIYFFFFTLSLYWFSFILSFNKFQPIFNVIYFFISFLYNIASSYLNKKNSILFFPFLLYLFLFIFFHNTVSLVPMIFASTSHFTFTLSICIHIWILVISLGFCLKTIKFFNVIIPKNVPTVLVPFLIFIEFISYIFRFISLSLRLFANILAGHILIHVLCGVVQTSYVYMTTVSGILYIFFLYGALGILLIFELIVAFLQSYIPFILSLIYLTDLETNNH